MLVDVLPRKAYCQALTDEPMLRDPEGSKSMPRGLANRSLAAPDVAMAASRGVLVTLL